MLNTEEALYPYVGRVIRVLQPDDNRFGSGRTDGGYRNVRTLHDNVPFARRMSEGSGERGLGSAGSIGDPRYRFQSPRYMPDVTTADELVLVLDGRSEAYNIVLAHAVPKRTGMLGDEIGGYTVFLAQRKSVQNTVSDIYQ